jgi:hypothetical protein
MTVGRRASNMIRLSSERAINLGRGNRPPRRRSSWCAAFFAAIGLGGCSFNAPGFGDAALDNPDALHVDAQATDLSSFGDAEPDDSTAKDVPSPDLDADLMNDAEPDGGVDSGEIDSGPPDTGPPDTGAEDAAPPDAEPPDTGPPDAGFPDAAPDAGPPDGACTAPPWMPMAQPRSVGTVTVGYDVDLAPLVVDADGDGFDELVVASTAQRQITVLDFGCGPLPVSASATQLPVGPAGLLALNTAGGTRILSAENGSVWFGRYVETPQPVLAQSQSPATVMNDIISMSSDDTGTFLFMTGLTRDSDPFFIGYDANGMPGPQSLAEAPIGRPSYFSHPMGSFPRFALTDQVSPFIARPGSSEFTLPDGSGIMPRSGTAVVAPGFFGGANEAFIAYGAFVGGVGGGPELGVFRIDVTNLGASARARMITGGDIAGGPIAIGFSNTAGFAFTTTDGVLAGCRLGTAIGWDCIPAIGAFNVGGAEVGQNFSPLTAYVTNDADPDVVLAARSGVVHFRQELGASQAAPSVTLQGRALATPAISATYFARFGLQGYLMLVPIQGGRMEIVIWSRPANAGPVSHLWLQDRRDAQRTGHLRR